MKLINGVLLSALVAFPFAGMAQDDAAEAGVKWERNLSMGATYRNGNSEKSLFTMNLKGDRFGEHHDVLSSLYAEYGKTGTPTPADPDPEKQQTEGQVRAQGEYRHKFGDSKFFAGIFAEGLHDSIKSIRFRGKVGPNIGYYFIDTDNMKLDASFGLNYVYERTAAGERTFGEYRAAGNYLWNITEKSSYYLNIEYTANMDDTGNDNGGLLVTGIRSQVYEELSLFAELRDEYDNLIDDQVVKHNDITLMAGLSYDF
ncbi:hypothetical protein PDESU_00111 [Pontiella desulfatans]|uniref:Salt-induced outer membrane protein n=1 Tax=Pontiella desulfatans TaxID=2750659 RepID=A0A6C2TW61_PONDE|nr:DUF481 domain-containing protein [Pontiella desulfatans]VGO11566.1 hypothetical protein PDESU_00111 [Pontiella desulfatans]